MSVRFLVLAFAPLTLGNADPATIPPAMRAMLDAALAGGNETDVATIVKYARSADPASADAVLEIATHWREERARARHERVRDAGPLELWKGRAELGGYASTGNTDNVGLTGVLNLEREGLEWRHKLRVQADYQESLGLTSREHILVAYEPNWKVTPTSYVYGATQFESDRFLGYDQRYSASAGAGYSAIKARGLTLDLELGPAYRHTAYVDGNIEASIAARGSLDLDWTLLSGLTLRQDASAYLQRYNSTLSTTTALAARLIGPLSAQVSYNVQYESMPAAGRVSTDTISRASIVYTF